MLFNHSKNRRHKKKYKYIKKKKFKRRLRRDEKSILLKEVKICNYKLQHFFLIKATSDDKIFSVRERKKRTL